MCWSGRVGVAPPSSDRNVGCSALELLPRILFFTCWAGMDVFGDVVGDGLADQLADGDVSAFGFSF